MALRDDLSSEVTKILTEKWVERDGQTVPEPEDLKLSNDAVKLNATVLYADLAESTALVQGYKAHFAAEVYKAYLYTAAKIVRDQGGVITAYDGDRIMGVFIGDSKNSSAAKTGLKINWAVQEILQPAIKKEYPDSKYILKQTVGIDTSDLFVARTGVRGANDLVWVGRAANYAAKLSDLSPDSPTWITEAVFDCLSKDAKYSSDGKLIWQKKPWTQMGGQTVYSSTWMCSP